MNRPTTAREALIVEALGDIALLLDRVESLTASMEERRHALSTASAEFGDRLNSFETGMSSITQQAKARAVEHIVRRTGEAARQSIEAQTRAMNEAARVAFTTQLNSTLAQLTTSLQQLIHRADRPWDLWLTHAATAASSAAITWLVATSFAIK